MVSTLLRLSLEDSPEPFLSWSRAFRAACGRGGDLRVANRTYPNSVDPTKTPRNFWDSQCFRLIQRADDTAEKAEVRLVQYHSNIAAIRECYEDITCSLDGSVGKEEVRVWQG